MVAGARDLEQGEGNPTKTQNRDEGVDGESPQRSGSCKYLGLGVDVRNTSPTVTLLEKWITQGRVSKAISKSDVQPSGPAAGPHRPPDSGATVVSSEGRKPASQNAIPSDCHIVLTLMPPMWS